MIRSRNRLRNLFAMVLILLCLTSCGDSPKYMVFTGKVVNSSTGEWPNNRLVLVFVNGVEVGRTFSKTGEFPLSGQGVHDGLFEITLNNTYLLPPDSFMTVPSKYLVFTDNYMYHWFGDVDEGKTIEIGVPSKNVKYVIKVLIGDTSTLPAEVLNASSTRLTPDNRIIAISPTNQSAPNTGNSDLAVGAIHPNPQPEVIEANSVQIPFNNCGGSENSTFTRTVSQSFIYKYQLETTASVSADLGLPANLPKIILQLQGRYGFEQNQIGEVSETVSLGAAPGTNQVYTIVWKEVWETGTMEIMHGTSRSLIPYKIKKNLISGIEDSKKIACN